MFELVAMEHFEEFFELGDPKRHAWTEGGSDGVLLDTLEAMRAHLSTVRRDGAPIRMVEHEDRYELEFDPCGSGGRALRGDIVEGTPSRIQEPYNFGVIKGAYDWTDGKSAWRVLQPLPAALRAMDDRPLRHSLSRRRPPHRRRWRRP